MSWHQILADLRHLDWSEVAEVVIAILVTWQLVKHRLSVLWLRFATDKARDLVLAAQRAVAEAERRQRALEAENAELRGMVAAGRQALAEPRRLELVERRAR